MISRDAMVDMLYEEVRKEVPISRAAYGNSLHGWEIDPVEMDGKVIGVRLLRNGEIHVQLTKRDALLHSRRIIRKYVVGALARFGYLTTRCSTKSDAYFVERLGFKNIGNDGALTVYRLDALKIQ